MIHARLPPGKKHEWQHSAVWRNKRLRNPCLLCPSCIYRPEAKKKCVWKSADSRWTKYGIVELSLVKSLTKLACLLWACAKFSKELAPSDGGKCMLDISFHSFCWCHEPAKARAFVSQSRAKFSTNFPRKFDKEFEFCAHLRRLKTSSRRLAEETFSNFWLSYFIISHC